VAWDAAHEIGNIKFRPLLVGAAGLMATSFGPKPEPRRGRN